MAKRMLTAELMDRLGQAVQAGTPMKYAVRFVGISERVVYDWIKRGETYAEHLEAGGEELADEAIFMRFAQSVDEWSGTAVVGAVARIREAMNGRGVRLLADGQTVAFSMDPDWRAAAWYLEHSVARHDFHKVREVEMSGGVGVGISLADGPAELLAKLEPEDAERRAIDIARVLIDADVIDVDGAVRPGPPGNGDHPAADALHPPGTNGEAGGVAPAGPA